MMTCQMAGWVEQLMWYMLSCNLLATEDLIDETLVRMTFDEETS